MNINIYVNENKKTVIAVAHFDGQSIRGIAKCHPSDHFDVEYGMELATARCEAKWWEKKKESEKSRIILIEDAIENLSRQEDKAIDKWNEAIDEWSAALARLDEMEHVYRTAE